MHYIICIAGLFSTGNAVTQSKADQHLHSVKRGQKEEGRLCDFRISRLNIQDRKLTAIKDTSQSFDLNRFSLGPLILITRFLKLTQD